MAAAGNQISEGAHQRVAVGGRQGAQVAVDQRHQVSHPCGPIAAVVHLDVVDLEAGATRRAAGMLERAPGKVDAGDVDSALGEPRGVELGAATEVDDTLARAEVETLDDPVQRALDRGVRSRSPVSVGVEVRPQHLRRDMLVRLQRIRRPHREGLWPRGRSLQRRVGETSHVAILPAKPTHWQTSSGGE